MSKEKLYTILLHCGGWLVFFSLPVIFIISQSMEGNTTFISGNPFYLLSFTIYIVIFYLHTYFLFPRLYFQKRKALYFLSIVVLFGIIYFLRPYDRLSVHNIAYGNELFNRQIPPPGMQNYPAPPHNNFDILQPRTIPLNENLYRPQHLDIISITLFILVLVLSIALILEKQWRRAIQETARAEADKANAELSFLKAQINPHFLFNTLNNIYSLALIKSENVADAIMKLSNLMRYVTDDVNEDFVLLEKELDSIRNYISLQRLRLGKKSEIEFLTEGNTDGKMIAPLILMPFVENAFKHGISSALLSNIFNKLEVAENHIVFYTENRLFTTQRNTERTGIGITNTKKRLAQIYPGKYELDIASQNGLFTVRLVVYI